MTSLPNVTTTRPNLTHGEPTDARSMVTYLFNDALPTLACGATNISSDGYGKGLITILSNKGSPATINTSRYNKLRNGLNKIKRAKIALGIFKAIDKVAPRIDVVDEMLTVERKVASREGKWARDYEEELLDLDTKRKNNIKIEIKNGIESAFIESKAISRKLDLLNTITYASRMESNVSDILRSRVFAEYKTTANGPAALSEVANVIISEISDIIDDPRNKFIILAKEGFDARKALSGSIASMSQGLGGELLDIGGKISIAKIMKMLYSSNKLKFVGGVDNIEELNYLKSTLWEQKTAIAGAAGDFNIHETIMMNYMYSLITGRRNYNVI